jgi:hypothetical protein
VVTDETDEVKDIVTVENTRAPMKATHGANNVAGLTPKFKDVPESTFRESDTGENVLKRKVLTLVEIDG